MSTRNAHIAGFALAVVLGAFPDSQAAAQGLGEDLVRPQSAVATDLHSRDAGVLLQALREVGRIPAAERGSALRAALIGALKREIGTAEARYKRGDSRLGSREHELIPPLVRAVVELADPAGIPPLVRAPMGGLLIDRALIAFGDRALPEVLQVATAPDSHPDWVLNNLGTLRMMVELWGLDALDAPMQRRLREAAALYLDEPGEAYSELTDSAAWEVGVVLRLAIDLAIVLDDPVLRGRVTELASDAAKVRSLGITDPYDVEKTQSDARDRLAGVPPLPRPPISGPS